MRPYLSLLQRILNKDRKSNDRTGTGTIKVAGEMMKFYLMRDGVKILPATTTKKLYFDGVVTELLWFRDGETNAMLLIAQKNKIWNDWMMPEDVMTSQAIDQKSRIDEFGKRMSPHLQGQAAVADITSLAIKNLYERTGNCEYAPGRAIEGRLYQHIEISHEIDAILDSAGIVNTTYMLVHSKGDLGPIYGHTWRHAPAGDYFKNMSDTEVLEYIAMMAPDQKAILVEKAGVGKLSFDANKVREVLTAIGIDQVSQALHKLKTNPNDRRIIVDAWTPQFVPIDKGADMAGLKQAEISQLNVKRGRAALAYCHVLYQFLTEELTTEERLGLLPRREWGGSSPLTGTGLTMPAILALSHQYVESLKAGTIAEEDIPKDHEGNHNNSVDTGAMLNALKIPQYKLNCVVYQRSQQSAMAA